MTAAAAADAFSLALGFTLRKDIEGGWYDGSKPHDPNPTNLGVTLATLIDARLDLDGDGDSDVDDLRKLTPGTAAPLYNRRYWLDGGCDLMPLPVAIAHFDLCVNAGCGRAAMVLQEALGIEKKLRANRVGPRTLEALRKAFPYHLVQQQLRARQRFYLAVVATKKEKLPALPHWTYRVLELWDYLETIPGAV